MRSHLMSSFHLQLYGLASFLILTNAFVPLCNSNARLSSVGTLPVPHMSSLALLSRPSFITSGSAGRATRSAILAASVSQGEGTNMNNPLGISKKDNEEENDDEWEFEEYEMLSETDFYGSEWKVGTLMDGSKSIDETWCRCAVKDGQFIAVWGDGSEGKWSFDAASQFFSITKESFGGWLGKKIWAGTVDDYYFMEGTVRGWSPISPASVVGQWQMKRLGVDPEEAGVAPWFQRDDDDDDALEKDDDGKGLEKNDNIS